MRSALLRARWFAAAALLTALAGCSLSIGSEGVDFDTHGKRDETVELTERRRFDAMVAQDVANLRGTRSPEPPHRRLRDLLPPAFALVKDDRERAPCAS